MFNFLSNKNTYIGKSLGLSGSGVFNPLSLFSNGEQGVWYDPSDIKNYMATGPNLVLNSDFSDGLTNWAVSNATAVVNNGIVTITNTDTWGLISQSIPTIIGKRYIVEFEIIEPGDGISVTPFDTSDGIGYYYPQQPGIYRLIFTASSTITSIRPVAGAYIGDNGSFNFVTTKELINVTNATMYQDALGTIPVDSAEQPVGLILDKSRGAIRGPELLSNGDFSSGATGWSIPAGWALTGSTCTATATSASLRQLADPYIAGKFYEVTFDWTHTSGLLYVRVGVGTAVTFNTSGRKRAILMANGIAGIEFYGGSVSGIVDNISVKEVYGNHAYQTTAIDRPILRNLYNLLTKTINFSDAGWFYSNALPTPNYDGNFALLDEGTDNSIHCISHSVILITGKKYTLVLTAKQGTGNRYLGLNIAGGAPGAIFDLVNGVVLSTQGGGQTEVEADIENLGNGFYRCKLSFYHSLAFSSTSYRITLSDTPSTTSPTYIGNNSTLIIGEPQFTFKEHINLPYQRVDTTTLYDSDLNKFPVYLACNGTNTWMQTNNIDFTGSDEVNIFLSVRKLSDIAIGEILSSSTSPIHTDGAFGIYTPVTPGGGYYLGYARGTAITSTGVAGVAPDTSVITFNSSITPSQLIGRLNGKYDSSSYASQGTGNYGIYPLYLFRRAGTSLPFNGNLYGLIIRGKLSTDSQIQEVEKYLAKKSGITL